jgi:hypothetical protein
MRADDFFVRLGQVRQSVNELDQVIDSVKRFEQQTQRSSSDAHTLVQSIEGLAAGIDTHYKQALKNISEVLKLLEILRTTVPPDPPIAAVAGPLPSIDEVRQNLTDFFRNEIKRMSAPLPSHTGCYAWRIDAIPPGHFMCARFRGSYVLMVMSRFESGTYYLYDPAGRSDSVREIAFKKEDWTPLPTVFPVKPLKRWEYSKGSRVLALRPIGDTGTTEFFPATVLLQPSDRSEEELRGYCLKFEDGKQIISEKFIVSFRDNWLAKDDTGEKSVVG